MESMTANFHETHQRLYTYALPRATVELVNLRVTAQGALPRHDMSRLPAADGQTANPESVRQVLFSRADGFIETPVYRRDALTAGMELEGPAVVEQRDATTLLPPGFRSKVDAYGNLVIRKVVRD